MFAEIQFIFQFKVPPQAPYKNVVFNHEIFKETNKENVLTRAILKQFDLNQDARDAAWDYNTLKRSFDTLTALKGAKPENTKVTSCCMNIFE